MKYKFGISKKITSLLLLMIAVAVVNIVVIYNYLKTNQGDTYVVNIAGRQRMLSQKIAKQALSIANGKESFRPHLKRTVKTYDLSLKALKNGGNILGGVTPAWPDEIAPLFQKNEQLWHPLMKHALIVANASRDNVVFTTALSHIINNNEILLEKCNQLVKRYESISRSGLYEHEINVAGRLRVLSQQMSKLAFAIAAGDDLQRQKLKESMALFSSSLLRLRKGGLSVPWNKKVKAAPESVLDVIGVVEKEWMLFEIKLSYIQTELRLNSDMVESVNFIVENNENLLVISNDITSTLDDFFSKKAKTLQVLLIIMLCFDFVIFFIGYNLSLRITRPLKYLAKISSEIGRGDLKKNVEVASNDEVGELATSLNEMVRNLRKSSDELLVARNYTDNVLKCMNDSLFIVGSDGMIQIVNSAFLDLLGYEEDEIVGQMPSLFFEKEKKDSNNSLLESHINKGEIGSFITKEGLRIPMNLRMSAMHDGNEAFIAYIGIARDMRQIFSLVQDLELSKKDLEQRVIERTKELKSAKDLAEKANEAKSIFLSSMSHELRTPMNSVLGFAQLMDNDIVEPLSESQKENINHILKSGNHLLELINEVLDFAGIESGNVQLSLERIEINTVINEVITTVGPIAEENSITIINKTKSDVQHIMADNTRLRQVLINLLSNAIKYNNDGGSVSIWIESSTDKILRVNVEDTGNGIAKEDMKFLFEPFNRLGAESLNIEGTGVGLTITKRLVEMMGGRIGVESDVGKGAKFYADFNKAEFPVLITDKKEDAVAEKKEAEITKRYTMLYVEDNPTNLKLVENILLRRPGISLLSAPQALSGVELARNHKPDIILMDINLPGIDGYEALKLLKSYDDTKNIPVIAISANAMSKDIERGKSAGFRDYVTKPINVNKFLVVIDGVLQPLTPGQLH